ncbi:hypothetical protein [Rubellicoccus peritrichatus]|uniref:Uncharacterized protein n=1 Tax=Rubellicoccus peritrichatus TaxID=3080537 RepID=A0AAQ3QUP2_9BACT|nr:hypothetical protein [Puniceicoccus sp. CR14]WOO42586.1 hypothetical protein RZN69_05745 [Puniceicoccus sp. CR14]
MKYKKILILIPLFIFDLYVDTNHQLYISTLKAEFVDLFEPEVRVSVELNNSIETPVMDSIVIDYIGKTVVIESEELSAYEHPDVASIKVERPSMGSYDEEGNETAESKSTLYVSIEFFKNSISAWDLNSKKCLVIFAISEGTYQYQVVQAEGPSAIEILYKVRGSDQYLANRSAINELTEH